MSTPQTFHGLPSISKCLPGLGSMVAKRDAENGSRGNPSTVADLGMCVGGTYI